MHISVFGSGYVGLVTAACFSEMGNDVVCVDVDTERVSRLLKGECPIYEPELPSLIARNLRGKRLTFTTDASTAVQVSDVIFVAVGTPSSADGSADLRQVMQVADTIGGAMTSYKCVVTKSTVPVGTSAQIHARLSGALEARALKLDFDVVSNPEFLKEGSAVDDCLKPDRVIVGCDTSRAHEMMAQLYASFLKNNHPLIVMDIASAELSKYAANAMLATRISFMNELAHVCERAGADIEQVRQGMGSDRRIGSHFLYAGLGYGGSCFPKDVRALIHSAEQMDENLTILRAVDSANMKQRERFFSRIQRVLGSDMKDKRVAVWGLAFKPGTDDIRDAPSVGLLRQLLASGAQVTAYDPAASRLVQAALPQSDLLSFADNHYDALTGADALCVVTEWKEFRDPDFVRMKSLMRKFTVFDGRNIYDPAHFKKFRGACYISIGRSTTHT